MVDRQAGLRRAYEACDLIRGICSADSDSLYAKSAELLHGIAITGGGNLSLLMQPAMTVFATMEMKIVCVSEYASLCLSRSLSTGGLNFRRLVIGL